MADSDIANGLIRLFTEFPCAGSGDANFSVEFRGKLSEEAYSIFVQNIEFRRKCMHQGFDNLLELLEMHRVSLRKMESLAVYKDSAPQDAESGRSGPDAA